MEKKNQKILIIAPAVMVLFILLFAFIKNIKGSKTTIAFYNLNEREANGLQEEIIRLSGEKAFSFARLEGEDGFKEKHADREFKKKLQEVNASLVFVKSDFLAQSAASFAKKKSEIKESELNIDGMTTSIRAAVKKNARGVTAVPLLTDNLEIDIDFSAFRNSGMKAISTWKDIEDFAIFQKRYVDYPIVFAGKDEKLTLDIFGALTEAFDGTEEYERAVEIISENSGKSFNAPKVAELLAAKKSGPLYQSVRYISKLYKSGLLHPNTFTLSKTDIKAYAKARIASVVFMTLDDHRDFDTNVISRYSSIYFPSDSPASKRNFSAPLTYAIVLENNSSIKNLVSRLTQNDSEERLSLSTGLAPVLARCHTPDKQSDDVRYWVAATNTPLSGLSSDSKLTKLQQKQLAAELVALATR